MGLKDWIKGRVQALDDAAQPWAARSRLHRWAYEFLLFGLKQAWASLFAGAMLTLLVATRLWWPAHAPVARYDALVIAAVALQAGLLALKLEHWDEAVVIFVYHLVGTLMELFKTAHGSWTYPEHSLLRIGGVPLFSGFMYACIGSYIARAWRLFDFRFSGYPPLWAPWLLAVVSYANFFADHYGIDIRWGLFAASLVIFRKSWIWFTPDRKPRRMPLVVSAVLASFFVWLAENLGTAAGAWIYPSQRHGWTLVDPAKMGSWYLLMMLSFVLVTLVRRPQSPDAPSLEAAARPEPAMERARA